MRKKREDKYVTIKTVAEEANVSTATVSRVINGGIVKDEKKRAVLNAIKKLNYIPNNSARNLAAVKTTKRISLVIPKLSVSYIDMIQGFKEGLKIYKYEGIIEEFYNKEEVYIEINDELERSSEIKGIVQFAPRKELINKVIFSVFDDDLKVELSDKFKNKKIAIHINDDNYLEDFYLSKVFQGASKYKEEEEYDMVVVEKIDEALELYNNGYRGDIKIIESTKNINKIFPNMSMLNIDMYKFGLYISRFIIKRITEVKTGKLEIVIED